MAAKRVLVPIADDSEEIETTCITDTLTRFGAEVVVASVKADGELVCKMSRGVKMVADIPIEDATEQDWDLVVRNIILRIMTHISSLETNHGQSIS